MVHLLLPQVQAIVEERVLVYVDLFTALLE